MHHVIWAEHDGSWTWSIEEGKAFEDDHKVLARDDGFPTRGDAKEDMQKAWAKLLAEGKRPGKLADLTKKPDKPKSVSNTTTQSDSTASQAQLHQIPEWAVVADDALIALFVTKADAVAYAKNRKPDSCSVVKVKAGISM